MPKSNGASMNCGVTRVASVASFDKITAAAPASAALAAGKSRISHPLVDVLLAPEWMTMSFVGTTSRFVNVPDWANPNVIMSTAVPDADDGDEVNALVPHVSLAGVFSRHTG